MFRTTVACCAFASFFAATVHADTATSSVPMRWVHGTQAGQVVEGSYQDTLATPNGAHMTVVTNGLKPGHAYTLWFVFFNHPDKCLYPPNEQLRCGALDLFNEDADASLVYGDGLVATGEQDTFGAHVRKDVAPTGVEQVAWGSGILTNPLGAEYQAVLRNHGPSDPNYPDQTTTLNGGCRIGEPYRCTDDQASGFRAQLPIE